MRLASPRDKCLSAGAIRRHMPSLFMTMQRSELRQPIGADAEFIRHSTGDMAIAIGLTGDAGFDFDAIGSISLQRRPAAFIVASALSASSYAAFCRAILLPRFPAIIAFDFDAGRQAVDDECRQRRPRRFAGAGLLANAFAGSYRRRSASFGPVFHAHRPARSAPEVTDDRRRLMA